MVIRALVFLIAFFLAISAAAGTRDPNTPDSKYIEFGTHFPCVQRIRTVIKYKDKDTYQYGSAVIIRPHWILTAAHVVSGSERPEIVRDDDTKMPLTELFVHDEYKSENVGYHDIALGYSPEDFNLDFYCPLYTRSDEMDKPVTIAGYGITGTFITGITLSDNKRRGGHNKVEGIERAVLVCKPSRAGKLPLEFLIAPGDSGGGLFIGNELAGISSFVMAEDKKPDSTYTDEAAHTRISLYADWVEAQIRKHEQTLVK
jgi:hypothetical protein